MGLALPRLKPSDSRSLEQSLSNPGQRKLAGVLFDSSAYPMTV